MKKFKVQVLLLVVLLSNAGAMQGMTTRAAYATKAATRARVLTTQPRYQSQKPVIKPVEEEQEEEQQSWGGWFKSLFTPKESNALPREESTILTGKEIANLLEGHIEGPDQNHSYQYMLFGNEDLEKAKQKLGNMLDQNDDYKDLTIVMPTFNMPLHRPANDEYTILDKVLFRLFQGEENSPLGGMWTFTPSESSLNYISLIQYLIDKGAQINPNNEDTYKKAYSDLMKVYKNLYGSQPRTIYGPDSEIQTFKEIFKELDPIMEQLIPDFGNELRDAQNKRAKIERENRFIGQKQFEDEHNKQEYMTAKRDYLFNDYQERTGSYPDFEIGFDEKEYRNWLKHNKSFNQSQLIGLPRRREETKAEHLQRNLTKSRENLTHWLDIPDTSSEKEIGDAYREFLRQHYPDMAKDPNDPMSSKLESINLEWDSYKRTLEKIEEEKESKE